MHARGAAPGARGGRLGEGVREQSWGRKRVKAGQRRWAPSGPRAVACGPTTINPAKHKALPLHTWHDTYFRKFATLPCHYSFVRSPRWTLRS